MNNFIKALFFYLFITSPIVGSSLSYEQKESLVNGYCKAYNPSPIIYSIILEFFDKTFRGEDISHKNLQNKNLTGWTFENVRITDGTLKGAKLANTTCIYKLQPLDNKNRLTEIFDEVSRIIYPKQKKDAHKAKLLYMLAGLYYALFDYEPGSTECNIGIAYFYCDLLRFSQTLKIKSSVYHQPIFGPLIQKSLSWARSWKRNSTKIFTEIDDTKFPHKNINQYLMEFSTLVDDHTYLLEIQGLHDYRVEASIESNHYVAGIKESMRGLIKVFSLTNKNEKIESEAARIAYGLCQLHRVVADSDLVFYYLHYQYRLVKLKEKLPQKEKKHIYYKGIGNKFIVS